jgi:hypothetical protein
MRDLAISLLAALFLLSSKAKADESHVITWTPPIQMTDGSLFTAYPTTIDSTRLQCFNPPNGQLFDQTIPAPTTSYQALFPSSPNINCHASVSMQCKAQLTNAEGTWTFDPNNNKVILINGTSNNGGQGSSLSLTQTGKMYAVGTDGNWWIHTPATGWVQTSVPTEPLAANLLNTDVTHQCASDPSSPDLVFKVPFMTTTDARIFSMKQTLNSITFTQVGTAPLQTTCDYTQKVLDKYVVARDKVTWLGNVKPQVVFGLCN